MILFGCVLWVWANVGFGANPIFSACQILSHVAVYAVCQSGEPSRKRWLQLGTEQAAIRLKPFIDQKSSLRVPSKWKTAWNSTPPIIQKRWLAQRSLASVQDARKVMHIVCEGLWRSGIPRERHRMSSNTTSSQLPLALQSRHASRKCPRGLRRPMPRPERLSEI